MSEQHPELEAARAALRAAERALERSMGRRLEERRRSLMEEAAEKVRDLEEELGIPLQERIDWLKGELARCRHFPPGQPVTLDLRRSYHDRRRPIARRISELRARLEGSKAAAGDG